MDMSVFLLFLQPESVSNGEEAAQEIGEQTCQAMSRSVMMHLVIVVSV